MIKRILIGLLLLVAGPVVAQDAHLVDMKPVPDAPGMVPSNFPRYVCMYQADDGHVEARVFIYTCLSKIKVKG